MNFSSSIHRWNILSAVDISASPYYAQRNDTRGGAWIKIFSPRKQQDIYCRQCKRLSYAFRVSCKSTVEIDIRPYYGLHAPCIREFSKEPARPSRIFVDAASMNTRDSIRFEFRVSPFHRCAPHSSLILSLFISLSLSLFLSLVPFPAVRPSVRLFSRHVAFVNTVSLNRLHFSQNIVQKG